MHRHIRISMGSYNRVENNRFEGGVLCQNSSRAVQIDNSNRAGIQVVGTVFANNYIDFSNATGDGAIIFFQAATQDSTIFGNTLIGSQIVNRGTSK
jgi:hypothetical protein